MTKQDIQSKLKCLSVFIDHLEFFTNENREGIFFNKGNVGLQNLDDSIDKILHQLDFGYFIRALLKSNARNNKIEAIKLIKYFCNYDLKKAKELADKIQLSMK